MADPDAIRYLRIAQADLAEAQRSDSLEISPPDWPLLLAVTSSLLTQVERQLS